jgi:uncharacterized membrane protein YhaH (DUF805 family)
MKLDFRTLYTQPEGRLDRTSFWLAGLILAAIYYIVRYIAGLVISVLLAIGPQQFAQITAFIFNIAMALAFLYPAYCLFVKRGYDREHPAIIVQALALFVAVIYVAPKLIIFFSTPEAAKTTLQSLSGGFWVIYLLLAVSASYMLYEYGLRSGTKGKNRFGEAP